MLEEQRRNYPDSRQRRRIDFLDGGGELFLVGLSRQCSEGRPEYFVRHQFGSQQPLEHQPSVSA